MFVIVHENSKKFIFITIPKPRGIPPSVCSGTSNLENPMQKAEPSLGALALRTRGGRLKSSFLPWELSLPTQVAHGYGYPHIIQIINYMYTICCKGGKLFLSDLLVKHILVYLTVDWYNLTSERPSYTCIVAEHVLYSNHVLRTKCVYLCFVCVYL